jgi:hypothetical protein
MSEKLLPDQFAHLSSWVAEWCLPTEKLRAIKRVETDIARLREFQRGCLPDLEAMIQYLNTFPNDIEALPPDAKRLYVLAAMVMEASAPIDLGWESGDIEDVFPMERMTFEPPSGP